MKLKDFRIGKTFWMSGKKYKTADIGKKVVVAIEWNPGGDRECVLVKYDQDGERTEKHTTRKVTLRDLRGDMRDGGDVVIHWYDLAACYRRRPKWMEIRK